MKYTVKLNEGKDIIDLCYAIKDVGKVVPITVVEEALRYIKEQTRGMPLNGAKIRLLEIKEILEGGKND